MIRNTIPPRTVRVQVVCADMSGLLSGLNAHDIPLLYVKQLDELTASFCIPQVYYQPAMKIIAHFGGEVSGTFSSMGTRLLRGLVRRPVLIGGVILMLMLTFYLPSRILFVKVSGNHQVYEKEIMEAASDCGIYFGAARHEIRSEKVKNQLISKIPALKWVGVNTRGCVAEISVRERALSETNASQPPVSSVIASRDGVIREMTVINGSPVCRVGQAVKAGDLLVSGYSDCGRCIYGTRAEAEIYAQTRHILDVAAIPDGYQRRDMVRGNKKIGLIIGKKRINFYKGSGISDTTCVRMYIEYPLTLPGGYQLPIVLTIQEVTDCNLSDLSMEPESTEQVLAGYAQSYLQSQMVAGKVVQGNYQITEKAGSLHLVGEYICDEMIGQTRSEESINQYEQTD